MTPGTNEPPALFASIIQIIAGCLLFHFLRTVDKVAFTYGKLPSGDSPLGEPERILLATYSGPDSGSSRTEHCLSNAPCDCLQESQKFMTTLQICITVLEIMLITRVYEKC